MFYAIFIVIGILHHFWSIWRIKKYIRFRFQIMVVGKQRNATTYFILFDVRFLFSLNYR